MHRVSPRESSVGARSIRWRSLTSVPFGQFDMNGNGLEQITAWPDAAYGNAFLALPDPHGKIRSVLQLFGNHTPQPPCSDNFPHCQNGLRALAVYDDNGDGVIDKQDKVWPHLRLWIDKNMNGKVDDGELITLNAAGITSISLKYVPTMTHLDWATLRYESTPPTSSSTTRSSPRVNKTI